jgi:hypothetical protein
MKDANEAGQESRERTTVLKSTPGSGFGANKAYVIPSRRTASAALDNEIAG